MITAVPALKPLEAGPSRRRRPVEPAHLEETAFGRPRDFLSNRFVYIVISPRARGLSVGVNMNPDKSCDFDCAYCEVDRQVPSREAALDVPLMAQELDQTLTLVHANGLRHRPAYALLPEELLRLRHVALSGDGEPTICPNFAEAVEEVVHVRALARVPSFKMVLITNATGLDLPQVQDGLRCFTPSDEVWAKLDAGTQAYMDQVNKASIPLSRILENIKSVGRQRPVIIQSLFSQIGGEEPPAEEIDEYAARLRELKSAGAQIHLVQIYSATRPSTHSNYTHLPLKTLSAIARKVRDIAGIPAEVF
jgi:wyosine [tRNA(Phe)-imidazoG37] synthetase (radical SAM superfamily)